MVTADDLHMTKSHLLRRLLQRRVEMLEAEKDELRSEITTLEERLKLAQQHSAPVAEGMEDVVDETLDSIRILTENAKNEADYTMKVTRHEQEKLILEMTNLRREGERLKKLLMEAMEGINTIQEQAQTRTSLLVKEAHLQQEKLIVEVQNLYGQNGHGGNSTAFASKQKKAFTIRNQAENEVSRLTEEARAMRERLLEDLSALQKESSQLQEAMTQVVQRANAISEWTYMGASRAIGEELPESLREPPAVVDKTEEEEAAPATEKKEEKRSVPWWIVVLFFVFVIAMGLPFVTHLIPQPYQAWLFDYRYLIWICAGPLTYWLLSKLRGWDLDARTSKWHAERDYALWRIRNALFALALLIPLLVLTTAVALNSTY